MSTPSDDTQETLNLLRQWIAARTAAHPQPSWNDAKARLQPVRERFRRRLTPPNRGLIGSLRELALNWKTEWGAEFRQSDAWQRRSSVLNTIRQRLSEGNVSAAVDALSELIEDSCLSAKRILLDDSVRQLSTGPRPSKEEQVEGIEDFVNWLERL